MKSANKRKVNRKSSNQKTLSRVFLGDFSQAPPPTIAACCAAIILVLSVNDGELHSKANRYLVLVSNYTVATANASYHYFKLFPLEVASTVVDDTSRRIGVVSGRTDHFIAMHEWRPQTP